LVAEPEIRQIFKTAEALFGSRFDIGEIYRMSFKPHFRTNSFFVFYELV
jgi:hypothetical protein